MSIDIKNYTAKELTTELLDQLIDAKDSFKVVSAQDIGTVSDLIEGRIEKAGLSCRVYTEFRTAAIAGSLWGPTALVGAAAAVGIGVHRLVTWNPDYEIEKNRFAGSVTVTYKK